MFQRAWNFTDVLLQTPSLENFSDCDNTTCTSLAVQDLEMSVVLASVLKSFSVIEVIIEGENLRVSFDHTSCEDVPFLLMMHDSSKGHVGEGVYVVQPNICLEIV